VSGPGGSLDQGVAARAAPRKVFRLLDSWEKVRSDARNLAVSRCPLLAAGVLGTGPQAEEPVLAVMVADSNMFPIGDKQTLLAILKFQGGFD